MITTMDETYLAVNRANWDERAPAHAASPGYALDRFVADPAFLSDVVRFDVPRLGDVTGLLKTGGRLFLREGHPVLWSIDDKRTDDLVIGFPHLETAEATVWDEGGTYVESDVEFVHTESHDWNHGLGEIVTALLDEGLTITQLEEHDSVPWNALPGQMEQVEPFGEWRLADRPERLPHSYTLQAVRR